MCPASPCPPRGRLPSLSFCRIIMLSVSGRLLEADGGWKLGSGSPGRGAGAVQELLKNSTDSQVG